MASLILPSRLSQLPQGTVEADPYWLSRGLHTLYLLTPGTTFRDLVSGAEPTAFGAGSAGTLRTDGWETSGVATSGLQLPLNVSDVTHPMSVVACWRRISGVVSWSILDQTDFGWTGYYGQNTDIWTSNAGDFSGSLDPAQGFADPSGFRTVAFSFSGANTLRGSSNGGGIVSDAAAAVPGGTQANIALGMSKQSFADNPSVSVHRLYAVFSQVLLDAELQALSLNPYGELLRPQVRRIYFDLGAGGGFTDSALSAAGAAAVALASQAIAKAALSSAGVASVSPVGQAISTSALSAAGSATVAATGQALFSATITSAGVAAASFAGQSVSVSALASSGTATGAWTAKSLASSTVTAAGIASASFVALTSGFVDAVMSSAGVGAFAITAKSITQAVMSAAGTGAASWVGLVTGYADASFVMAGIAAASLAAQAIAQTAASSTATSTAAFSGQTLRQGAFSSAGSATSAWMGQSIAGAVLGAVGAGAAAFVGKAVCQASAYAAGVGSVNWAHGNGPVVPALLRITAIRLMTVVGARPELAPHVSARHRLN